MLMCLVVAVCSLLLPLSLAGGAARGVAGGEGGELGAASVAERVISLLVPEAGAGAGAFQEARDKLVEISGYVVPRHLYTAALLDEAGPDDAEAGSGASFYQALKDDNDFDFLRENNTKNLYLKLKERLNRDDILKMISSQATRRQGEGRGRGRGREEELDTAVDRLLARAVSDDHHHHDQYRGDEGPHHMYWDPAPALEELHGGSGRRLYRGERTTVRFYPFMVSIHVMGRFWCGGVIYWHDLVLTSAACLQLMHNNRFFRENPRVLSVRIGSNHSRIGGEKIDALEVYFHPGYNPRTLEHNIAVVRLRRHLFFNNKKRIPKCIELGEFMAPPSPTAQVLLLGWGVNKSTQKMSYEPVFLQSKMLPVYPNVFCKEVYGDKFINQNMFCAGTMSTGEGACDHDAGGPAVINGKLAGIISFGPTVCGYPNTPTVFTLIGPYLNWIDSIQEAMPKYYISKKRTTTTEEPYPTRKLRPAQRTYQETGGEGEPTPPLYPVARVHPPPPPPHAPRRPPRPPRTTTDTATPAHGLRAPAQPSPAPPAPPPHQPPPPPPPPPAQRVQRKRKPPKRPAERQREGRGALDLKGSGFLTIDV